MTLSENRTAIDLSNLTPSEYEKITSVLMRDKELRSIEEARIRQLKQELICIRKRAALKPGLDPLRNCARCLTELGRIINRGALCPLCLKKVCKDCRHYGDENHEWLCIYCYKQMQLKAISGEWMLDYSRLSSQNRAKESSNDKLRSVLPNTQNKGLLSSDVAEPTFSQLPVDPPPEKPPRIFTYEPPKQNIPPESNSQITHTKNGDCSGSKTGKNSPEQQRDINQSSPSALPRVSPWSEIDTDPTIPERIDKSRPFGGMQHFESLSFKERQSSDESHSTVGYRSRSMSSDVMEESEPYAPVPLPRKRMNPLKKQQAIPEPNPVDNQQSSVDTTDSGVFSPGLKTELSLDTNPPASPLAISRLSSNEQESIDSPIFAHCLASESSLSETDEDRRPHPKISGSFFRKRKTVHSRSAEEKGSVTSAEPSSILPPSGLSSFLHRNSRSNFLINKKTFKQKLIGSHVGVSDNPKSVLINKKSFKQKLIGSHNSVSDNPQSDSKTNTFSKQINYKCNLPCTNSQLNSKACTFYRNVEAPGLGGDAKGMKYLQKMKLIEQEVDSKKRNLEKNRLQVPHLRRKRSRKKEFLCKIQPTKQSLLNPAVPRTQINAPSSSTENFHSPHNSRKVALEHMETSKNTERLTLMRSASLPLYKTFSEDWLKPWLWKCHSVGDWVSYLDEQSCNARDFHEIVNMPPDDYKLVYVSSASSSSDSDSDHKTADSHTFQSKTYLKVNSHIEINYGTSYVEDSDWELESEKSDESESIFNSRSNFKINEASNFLIGYAPYKNKKCNVKETIITTPSNGSDLLCFGGEEYCMGNYILMIRSLEHFPTGIRLLIDDPDVSFYKSFLSPYLHSRVSKSDCNEIIPRKCGEIFNMNVIQENTPWWPRSRSERPSSHKLSLLHSSFMNIQEEKPDLNITHPKCSQNNLQLQLIHHSESLNNYLSFDELLVRSFRRLLFISILLENGYNLRFSNFLSLALDSARNFDTFSSSADLNLSFTLPVRSERASFPRCATGFKNVVSVFTGSNVVSFSRGRNSKPLSAKQNYDEATLSFENIIKNALSEFKSVADIFEIVFYKRGPSGNYEKRLSPLFSLNTSEQLTSLKSSFQILTNVFALFQDSLRSRTTLNNVFESESWWRDSCEGKVCNWLQLDDANAFHYSAFPLSSYATNRGNDNSATGWGKLRCCIAVATQRVIDLNRRALVCRREVLDSAVHTTYLGWGIGTEDKLCKSANLANAFLYLNPPVFKKPEAGYLFSPTRPELNVLFQRFLHERAETRMIAEKSEGTGVSSFDNTDHDNTLSPNKTEQNSKKMHAKSVTISPQNENLGLAHFNSTWITENDRQTCRAFCKSETGCFRNVNKHRSAFLHRTVLQSVEYSDEYGYPTQASAGVRILETSTIKLNLPDNENISGMCDNDDSDFLDTEILPCIKNVFSSDSLNEEYLNCDHSLQVCVPSLLSDHTDNNERVDCQCNKPCEVPSSPSVVDATRNIVDDGEIFSSGDELDKFESDTDSQDTVIEGEAYKRIRSVAIKEKILHANEELFGSNTKEPIFNSHSSSAFSVPVTLKNVKTNQESKLCSLHDAESKIPNQSYHQTQYQNDVPELPIFSDSEESDTLAVFSSLGKHFHQFKNHNLPKFMSQFVEKESAELSESSTKTETHSLSSYSASFNETTCSSESSDNGSDDEEVILSDTSTSSDEAFYIAPAAGFQYYSHPMSYKLHTIAEESCEESERSSRNSSRSCSDFEYFDRTRLSLTKSPRKNYKKQLPDNPVLGHTSEVKNKGSAMYAVLATSRLEKYFKSNLQDGSKVSYPDDDMTDESGEVSSDDEVMSGKVKNQSTLVHKSEKQLKNSKVPLSPSERCFASIKCSRVGSPSSSKTFNADSKYFQQSDSRQELDSSKSNSELSMSESKQNKANDQVSDDEAKYIMNHLMQHITNNNGAKTDSNPEIKDMSPMLKILESEIARLMLTVSPASLSAGEPSSSCSSTIGSNNSDYGSDTLESAEDSTSEEDINADILPENRPVLDVPVSANSISISENEGASVCNPQSDDYVPVSDPAVSEETLYICKQLMASLKKIADSTEGASMSDDICVGSEDNTAKQYITDQIVSLMQTVNASQNNSPLLRRLSSHPSVTQIDSDVSQDCSDSDSPPPNDEKREHSKSKTPSESGSETTISASISIPSYDDSDRTPTESEISHEMDELYALLESGNASQDVINSAKFSYDLDNHSIDKSVPSRNADSPVSEDDMNFAFSESCDTNTSESGCSLLFGAASKLESLLPISIEERIARYKDAFLNKVDFKDQDSKSTETRINVILPQPCNSENICDDNCVNSSSLPSDIDCVLNLKSGEKLSAMKSCDNILSSCSVLKCDESSYNVTSVKIISHNTYPPSSAIHRILSSNIDSTYVDQKCDYNVVNICDVDKASDKVCEEDSHINDDGNGDPNNEGNESILSPLPKIINPKEKASSENDLLVANYRTKSKGYKVFGTKSVGNICELENISNKSAFRDTGYYSFKSSEESFLSLDDSTASQTSTASLTQYRSLTSTETIPEEEESSAKGASTTKMSLSSSNIPDAICDTSPSKSNTLPLSLRSRVSSTSNVNHRTRSSFFSTSGVLRKLTLLRDESGNSLRCPPHGRLRPRNRSLSGGSEDGRQRKASVPQISVSECESQSGRQSTGSSEKDSSGLHEEDPDQHFTYPFRSQVSLSSFGGRSESVTSVYSAAGGGRYGTVIVTGDVWFGLNYNYKVGCLEINVKECRNLAAVDTKKNRSDPYVKVYLLPDRTKSGKRKTKVKKHTLNPVFDEVLKFQVTVSELEIRTLWLSVWHSDRFGRNDFLGEVMLPLGKDTLDSSGLKKYPLQERLETVDPPVSYKGDLILALKYVPPDVTSRKFSKKPGIPAKGALEVLVREARNLMATRSNGTSDPFCKSYLLPDKSKAGKQKTPVIKKSCNPKWNHTFLYDDVSLDDLRERCLELTIWDYDKITSNDFLGGVRLCLGTGKYQGREVDWMDSVGEERSLWYTMLERPNTWVDGSLLLRCNMQSRRTM